MKRVSSAQFRRSYAHESKPVEVTAYDKVIGTWIPSGTALADVDPEPEQEAPAARFTIRPEKGPRRVMVGAAQRLLDPVDMREQERARSDEFQPRQWQRKA